jgi:uncharacterized protein
MNQRRSLVVMAKRPQEGEVKTRLAPYLGTARAAELYAAMLRDVLASPPPPGVRAVLAFAPAPDLAWWRAFPPAASWALIAQEGADLAERMRGVFDALLIDDACVVMRNSDSPDLDPELVDAAFRALDEGHEVVFGPDEGGGYYLVGMRAAAPEIFDVVMSTRHNFSETVRRVRAAGRRVAVLPVAPDVDEAADLEALRQRLRKNPRRAPHTAAWLAAQPPRGG